jgi:hypothetical protein
MLEIRVVWFIHPLRAASFLPLIHPLPRQLQTMRLGFLHRLYLAGNPLRLESDPARPGLQTDPRD